jgi:hypothetical protein
VIFLYRRPDDLGQHWGIHFQFIPVLPALLEDKVAQDLGNFFIDQGWVPPDAAKKSSFSI